MNVLEGRWFGCLLKSAEVALRTIDVAGAADALSEGFDLLPGPDRFLASAAEFKGDGNVVMRGDRLRILLQGGLVGIDGLVPSLELAVLVAQVVPSHMHSIFIH